ncbi:MAG: TRAM domain-containing protein [Elusimicrobiaceae bacterium]|nr:TRAM domain-containing protein [Elusimicrobiaceae bacterium]
MPIWIFRISTLVAFPFVTYTYLGKDWNSFLAGLACGAVVIAGEVLFKRMRLIKIMIGCTGVLLGLMLYALISYGLQNFGGGIDASVWEKYHEYILIAFLVFGLFAALFKSRDLEGLSYKGHHLKIADVSALVDGRIVDLCEINFLSGVIVLPVFVMDELNRMVSSKDKLEQARGRRGLDVATRLQELKEVETRFTSKTPKAATLAERIVKLARSFDAEIVTLDFTINKLATLKKVTTLNIADLTTALKPVILPGETMSLFVMKDGKEKEQGIGYLDDGTMVVVEEGRKQIGKRVEVIVSSIYQTSSGRMIFAKIK